MRKPRNGKDPVDVHVGRRIKERRLRVGVTPKRLAAALGVSLPQLAKYESGENRLGVSGLYIAARALRITTEHFFEGAEPRTPVADEIDATRRRIINDFLELSGSSELMLHFTQIRDERARRTVIDVARMAGAVTVSAPSGQHNLVEASKNALHWMVANLGENVDTSPTVAALREAIRNAGGRAA